MSFGPHDQDRYDPDDLARWEIEDELADIRRDEQERVCDLWAPMWPPVVDEEREAA